MASDFDRDMQAAAPAHQPRGPAPRAVHAFREVGRDLVDKLQRLAAADRVVASPVPAAGGRTTQSRTDELVLRARLAMTSEPWPPGFRLVVEGLACVSLYVAVMYGPSYYQCRQMKEGGLFFYGESVKACVESRASAQERRIDGAIRTWLSGR